MKEISRIERAASQVALRKPQSVFITGEYGIGKTSLAQTVHILSEKKYGLLGFHVLLGGANTLDGLSLATVEKIIKPENPKATVPDKIRDFLSIYIGEQSVFGITLRFDKLKKDAPNISHSYLPFLKNMYEQVKDDYKGLVLILDEINGITKEPQFAHFLKKLNDENALSRNPLPLLLILCGTYERYREIIANHQPVERIFDIAQIDKMTHDEMCEFFIKAFNEVKMTVDDEALEMLCNFSHGLPKLMHLIGDAAYWITDSKRITKDITAKAVIAAGEEIGRKFIDQQILKAIQSKDYHSILRKIAGMDPPVVVFNKKELKDILNQEEKKKFDNFFQRMKKLNVFLETEIRGEYKFCDPLTQYYLYLQSVNG